MSIYRVLHAELIFHGLEALRRDRGPVMKVLLKKTCPNSEHGHQMGLISSNLAHIKTPGRYERADLEFGGPRA